MTLFFIFNTCNCNVYTLNNLEGLRIGVNDMLKKILINAALISLVGSLSSCSYINKFTEKKEEQKEASYESQEFVEPAPTETVVHKHHNRHHHHNHYHHAEMKHEQHPSVEMAYGDELRDVTCTEVAYSSVSDKIQTLGYIPSSTALPEARPVIVKEKPKKVHHKPTKRAAKNVDAYNASNKKKNHSVEVDKSVTDNNMSDVDKAVSSNAVVNEPVQNKQVEQPVKSASETAHVASPKAAEHVTPPAAPSPAVPAPASTVPAAEVAPTKVEPAVPSAPTPLMPMPNEMSLTSSNNVVSVGRMATIDYSESSIDIPSEGVTMLEQIANDLKQNLSKNVKIQSYAFSKDGNATEARRNSLQRAIKVRKYLIDKGVSASRISVNAIEDINNKLNKVEISFEESKQ
ncbi:MAG: OmpA family protein [Candidatus Jidaibacter sp.]|jgi:outer membrane protein OmpA-like peptidoglycan-associated protein|nr:OmpA family protein [Candidatus Jidaibacter sp.]